MKPLIIALDVDTEKEALGIIKATKDHTDIFKIGPPLLLRYGPEIIKTVNRLHKKVFLDLKFHDIPNTMHRSIKEAHALGVFSATVHTSAGESALKTVADMKSRPNIWGVTVLTSLQHQDLMDLGFQHAPEEQVLRLGLLAKKTGLEGVVASVGETAALRAALGPQMTIVTPGIRMPTNEVGDQKRVATPSHARQAGSTFIVVGRPIVEAKDPGLAAQEILKDWKRGGKIH